MADPILNPTIDPAKQIPSDSNQPTSQEGVKPDLTSQPAVPSQPATSSDQPTTTPTSPGVSDMAKPVVPPPVAPGTDSGLTKPKESLPQTPPQPTDATSTDKAGEEVKPTILTGIPPVSNSVAPGDNIPTTPVVPAVETPKPVDDSGTPSELPVQEKQVPETTTPAPAVPAPESEVSDKSPTDDDLKKTHEPIVVLPDRLEMGQTVAVKVRVGMVPHVMEEGHFIQSIELFANDKLVGKVDLNAKDNPNPEADFQVALTSGLTLKAVAYCNVHGKWEATRSV
ncbi:desulfoferrodoxin family protein [Patescibacteria group bacterium]